MTDETPDPDEPLDATQARARDAVAAAPPALDDVTRRRLVSRALAEQAPQRSRRAPSRWPSLVAAAAAIAVVTLGAWALLASGSGKSDNASKGASANSTTPAARPALGEVSDPKRLLSRVRGELREPAATTQADSSALPGSRCATTVKTPAGVTLQPLASAEYRGAPAVVFVARRGSETLIYVLDQRDCRLLTSQFFHG